MSRCTPGHGWTSRMRRHGGLGAIAAKRAVQFQKLAQVVQTDDFEVQEEVRAAEKFLNGNAVRVLDP
jgi:hypothetical protein